MNRFAMFCDYEGDSQAMTPPASSYHGRASEPTCRTGNYGGGNRSRDSSKRGKNSRDVSCTGRQSREGSYSGMNSREGSYSGRTSREGVRIINSILKGKHGEDRTKFEDRTKPILAEYLHNVDLTEAFICIRDLYHIEPIHWLVDVIFNTVVKNKEKDMINAGKLLCYLLKNESLPRTEFVKGVNAVLEFSEDLLIDTSNFWESFANLLRTILVEGIVDLTFLKGSSSFLLPTPGLAGAYASAVLTHMGKMDEATTVQLWQGSGFSLADFKVENCEQFVQDNKLDFLNQDVENVVTSDGEEASKESLSESLDALLSKKEISLIFGFLDSISPSFLTPPVIRTIVSRVTRHLKSSKKPAFPSLYVTSRLLVTCGDVEENPGPGRLVITLLWI